MGQVVLLVTIGSSFASIHFPPAAALGKTPCLGNYFKSCQGMFFSDLLFHNDSPDAEATQSRPGCRGFRQIRRRYGRCVAEHRFS
jgi:hypothetical protein